MNKSSLSQGSKYSHDIAIAAIWLALYLTIAISGAVSTTHSNATAKHVVPQTHGKASGEILPRPL